MQTPSESAAADLEYAIRRKDGVFVMSRAGSELLTAHDRGELLFAFEKDVTVELQKLRRDLFFLHAASVDTPEGAVLFVGPSGAGKSTLVWWLVRNDFGYMSDELAPVCLERMWVHAYPRAFGLKERPPPPGKLPRTVLETSRGFHVRVEQVGGRTCPAPRPIRAIFFLEPGAALRGQPTVRVAGVARASVHLLANALNPLCHPADGLDAALAISRSAPCYELRAAELEATGALVRATLGDRAGRPRPSDDSIPGAG